MEGQLLAHGLRCWEFVAILGKICYSQALLNLYWFSPVTEQPEANLFCFCNGPFDYCFRRISAWLIQDQLAPETMCQMLPLPILAPSTTWIGKESWIIRGGVVDRSFHLFPILEVVEQWGYVGRLKVAFSINLRCLPENNWLACPGCLRNVVWWLWGWARDCP